MQKLATLVSLAVLAAGGADLKMQNIAHRGMWDKEVPQNTVEAIKRAYDSGATWVETDFHHTKADQMVCMHAEGELRKYTGCTKKVKDLDAATKVSVQLQLTDPSIKSRDRVVKKSEKDSLYSAIDVAVVWLERALASR